MALMPKRMVLLPSEDFTATTNFLAMTFFFFPQDFSFLTSYIQKYSKGRNVALTICSAGDLNARGIATGDDADRMGISAHHSGGWGQCHPFTSCASLAVRAPSLSSERLCNSF